MKIVHSFLENKTEQGVKNDVGFLLTDRSGGYFYLANQPTSRYQGWFFTPQNLIGKKIFKIIEDIELLNVPKISEVRNNFWNIERKRKNVKETFLLPKGFDSLIYELNGATDIELTLDLKESYDSQEFNRFYKIFKEKNNLIIIKCQNNEHCFYLAIKSDILDYFQINKWIIRYYQKDKERNSFPFERYVFKALRIENKEKKTKQIVFSISKEKKQAIKTAEHVFKNIEKLERLEKKRIEKMLRVEKANQETKMAGLCAQNSLNNLLVFRNNEIKGTYAGLPWFFQFWLRDEAISLKALSFFNPKIAKDILLKELQFIKNNLENSSVDGIGWIFKRVSYFIKQEIFNQKEIKEIRQILENTIDYLLEHQTEDSFALNNFQETWMDSLDRAGARIEIQALRLNIYNLAFKLTKKIKYFQLEKKLKNNAKRIFWDGKILADGFDLQKIIDKTIRPNIFLSFYIYPQLLKKQEWIKCFENILPRLFLNWGGIASLDKQDSLFQSEHSGEPATSYHQGDSWFWINNLTALVLYQIDKKKFKNYINKILKASINDILWQGIMGYHSELSSADKFKSQGCLAQAWSSALYLEMISNL